jgi:hypothetical protein
MKNFTDILKKITGAKMLRYGEILSPQRDWLVILTLTFLLLIGSCAWNAWTFTRLQNGEMLTVSSTHTTSDFDPSQLTAVQTLFAARAVEEAKYQNEYHFVDPGH